VLDGLQAEMAAAGIDVGAQEAAPAEALPEAAAAAPAEEAAAAPAQA
jgi:small subunit ribosomal protein S2